MKSRNYKPLLLDVLKSNWNVERRHGKATLTCTWCLGGGSQLVMFGFTPPYSSVKSSRPPIVDFWLHVFTDGNHRRTCSKLNVQAGDILPNTSVSLYLNPDWEWQIVGIHETGLCIPAAEVSTSDLQLVDMTVDWLY